MFLGSNNNPITGAHGVPDFGSPAHLFNVAGHAAVGCGSAIASGGECGPGALSGAVGSAFSPLTGKLFPNARTDFGEKIGGTVMQATVGGLASVAGGGKFANGAVTGAFGYLFNDVALACRDVAGTGGIGTHCGLFVYDEDRETGVRTIKGQYSLGNKQTKFNTVARTERDDLAAFNSGKGVYVSTPPSWLSQTEYDAVVMRDAGSYQTGTYRFLDGPNSNSAAAYPIIMNGGSLPSVRPGLGGYGAGAKGLDYWRHNSPF